MLVRVRNSLDSSRYKNYPIEHVARLSGYDSRSSFARAFQQAVDAKPSEYRRGKKGPARAGGATGAYAKRQRRPSYRPGVNEGLGAIWKQEFAEAEARLADRRALEQFERIDVKFSFIETVEEMRRPRRLRDDPAYWPSAAGCSKSGEPRSPPTTSTSLLGPPGPRLLPQWPRSCRS